MRGPIRELPEATPAFWEKVDRSGDCWLWTMSRTKEGYGAWRSFGAHRVALNSVVRLPDGDQQLALHRCDNPPCVNPDHLYWGTAKQNTRDMLERHPHFQRTDAGALEVIDRLTRLRTAAREECRTVDGKARAAARATYRAINAEWRAAIVEAARGQQKADIARTIGCTSQYISIIIREAHGLAAG